MRSRIAAGVVTLLVTGCSSTSGNGGGDGGPVVVFTGSSSGSASDAGSSSGGSSSGGSSSGGSSSGGSSSGGSSSGGSSSGGSDASVGEGSSATDASSADSFSGGDSSMGSDAGLSVDAGSCQASVSGAYLFHSTYVSGGSLCQEVTPPDETTVLNLDAGLLPPGIDAGVCSVMLTGCTYTGTCQSDGGAESFSATIQSDGFDLGHLYGDDLPLGRRPHTPDIVHIRPRRNEAVTPGVLGAGGDSLHQFRPSGSARTPNSLPRVRWCSAVHSINPISAALH